MQSQKRKQLSIKVTFKALLYDNQLQEIDAKPWKVCQYGGRIQNKRLLIRSLARPIFIPVSSDASTIITWEYSHKIVWSTGKGNFKKA